MAAFLMSAGYRAIVPGREDFLYSASWLKGMAQLLRDASTPGYVDLIRNAGGPTNPQVPNNVEEKLHMLAANLRQVGDGEKPTTDKGANPNKSENVTPEQQREQEEEKADEARKGLKSCPLLFSDTPDKRGARKTEASKCVLSMGENIPQAQDWLERLDVTLNPENGVAAAITQHARTDVYVRRQVLLNAVDILQAILPYSSSGRELARATGLQRALRALSRPDGYEIEGNKLILKHAVDSISPKTVISGAEGAVCYAKAKDTSREEIAERDDLCQLLKGVTSDIALLDQQNSPDGTPDFLLSERARTAARELFLLAIAEEEENRGYTFSGEQTDRTLITAVVGPETMKAVSPTYLEGVTVLDPRRTLEALLRGAVIQAKIRNDRIARILVMAQMPRTEAEELSVHLRDALENVHTVECEKALHRSLLCNDETIRVDLVLSEAQVEHASPGFKLRYDRKELSPVLTPHPAFRRGIDSLVKPDSRATLSQGHLRNETDPQVIVGGPESTVSLLAKTLDDLEQYAHYTNQRRLKMESSEPQSAGSGPKSFTDGATIEFVLKQLRDSSGADAVLMERRDLYLGGLPDGYQDYDICKGLATKEQAINERVLHCRVHMALDRILWKGDYSERVMVTGKDLTMMLGDAQNQVAAQESLAAGDTEDQWLVTFGITSNDQRDLTRLEQNGDRFVVPWSGACEGDPNNAKQAPHYCVTGSTIADDAAYWVATSDHIANDSAVYSEMKKEPRDYHHLVEQIEETPNGSAKPTKEGEPLFLTDELAKRLTDLGGPFIESASPPSADGAAEEVSEEKREKNEQRDQEDRSLVHLDYAKLVAGFNIRHPDGGDTAAAGFQGVTDTRPSQPNQQELDLETLSRLSRDILTRSNPFSFSVGMQMDVEYDRSALGNLTGKPVNASYASNNLTVGGFIQKRLPFWWDAKTRDGNWASREPPRTLLVLTPYQYQQQLTGNFLFLNFTAGNGELTVHTPIVTGHAYKAGIRHEMTAGRKWSFDRGSYWEAGFEYVVQNNVGRSLTLITTDLPPGQSNTKTCPANGTSTLAKCFSTFTIDSHTYPVEPFDLVTLLTTGLYWDNLACCAS